MWVALNVPCVFYTVGRRGGQQTRCVVLALKRPANGELSKDAVIRLPWKVNTEFVSRSLNNQILKSSSYSFLV